MEPRQQGLSGGIERTASPSGEYSTSGQEFLSGENKEKSAELQPEARVDSAEAAQVAMPALPTPVFTTATPTAQAADDDVPDVAGDDDLIEKEWVDKAKKIISETKDDPYRREREISKLQIEYIRRRYGREIGDSGDQ